MATTKLGNTKSASRAINYAEENMKYIPKLPFSKGKNLMIQSLNVLHDIDDNLV